MRLPTISLPFVNSEAANELNQVSASRRGAVASQARAPIHLRKQSTIIATASNFSSTTVVALREGAIEEASLFFVFNFEALLDAVVT